MRPIRQTIVDEIENIINKDILCTQTGISKELVNILDTVCSFQELEQILNLLEEELNKN